MSYDKFYDSFVKRAPGLLAVKKAFDSISWSFIYTVLICFGFGENYIDFIKILKTTFKASVLQCRHQHRKRL